MRKTPFRPGKGPARKTPLRARRHPKPRHADYTPDTGFQSFIRGEPCLLRGKPGHICGRAECAHLHGRGAGGQDARNIVPLCSMAHTKSPLCLHQLGEESFERRWMLPPGFLRREATRLWLDYQPFTHAQEKP